MGISTDWDDYREDDYREDDASEVLQRISQDFESPVEPVLRLYLQDLYLGKVNSLLEILREYGPFHRRGSGAFGTCDLVLRLRMVFESRESSWHRRVGAIAG